MSAIVEQEPCHPCLKKLGIPPAYNHPYHSRGFQPYPEPAKPPKIPSGLRKSIEEERRASMTVEEFEEYSLKKKKKHQPKKIDVRAILNSFACPEPKEKIEPPKPRKPPPGVSLVYWKLQQERFMKPPPVNARRREKFSVDEATSKKQTNGFPVYESPSYLEEKPRYHFTPKKTKVTPSPAVKSIIVRRYGRQLMSDLDSLKTKFRAFDIKPADHTNIPVNRLDWACEKFRQCASANLPAWYNLLRSYVLGPPGSYFFFLNRPEALDCWERMQEGNYQIKNCCVEKPKYKSRIPVIPSLKTPPKKVYDPCEEFRKVQGLDDPVEPDDEYETDDEEFLEEMKQASEFLILHQSQVDEVNRKSKYDDEMVPILKVLGNKESISKSSTGSKYEGEEEGEGISEEMEEEEVIPEESFQEDQERFIKSGSIVPEPMQVTNRPSLTQLDVASTQDKLQDGGCTSSKSTKVTKELLKPPHFPPFCEPVPPADKRLPWQIPPLRPRDGDEPPFSFDHRAVDLGDVISTTDDPYGERRKKQKAEMRRQIRWAMLKGFFHRNGMPAVETMGRLMKLDIPEDHPLTKFKLNKALHKLLFLKDTNDKEESETKSTDEDVDVEKLKERAAARRKKPDFSHIKAKYMEPSGRYRKILWL